MHRNWKKIFERNFRIQRGCGTKVFLFPFSSKGKSKILSFVGNDHRYLGSVFVGGTTLSTITVPNILFLIEIQMDY
jgi:hypothetical protein